MQINKYTLNAYGRAKPITKIALLRGLSLIELLVAMTIGLIILAGIVNIYMSSSQAYRVQRDISVMQENSRTALHMLTKNIRMADHWGGVDVDDISVGGISLTGKGSCDTDWIVEPAQGIIAYEGSSSSPLPSGCIADDDYVANTDILVVRHGSTTGMVANSELDDTTPNNADRLYIKSVSGTGATIDNGSDLYDDDTNDLNEFNFPYTIAVYFIRPCFNKAGSVCAATDDEGSPVPTLVRLTLSGDTLIQEALIDGVEQLQFEYGIMDANGSITLFQKASVMSSANWDDTGAVKMGLIVRSGARDSEYTDTATYRFPDPSSTATAGEDDFTPSGSAQKYRRKQYIKTVQIRNRTRG